MFNSCINEASSYFSVPAWSIKRNVVHSATYVGGSNADKKYGVTGLSIKYIKDISKNKKNQLDIEVNPCVNIFAFAYKEDSESGVDAKWKKSFYGNKKRGMNKSNENFYNNKNINWGEVNKLRSLSVQMPLKNICIDAAAEKYKIPYYIFIGILKTESGQVGKVNFDKNGSYDIGPAQINSIHLPWLESKGISEHKLKWNACENIFVGAEILSEALKGAASSNPNLFWEKVGDYNSNTPIYNHQYGKMVYENIKKIFPNAFN
jgi:hypothetical protein